MMVELFSPTQATLPGQTTIYITVVQRRFLSAKCITWTEEELSCRANVSPTAKGLNHPRTVSHSDCVRPARKTIQVRSI